MSRHRIFVTAAMASICLISVAGKQADGAIPLDGQQAVTEASQQGQYAFVLFYRTNDKATSAMLQEIQATLSSRNDATMIPVQVTDPAEKSLVDHFDASRLPMPSVAVIAPNGAVTGVMPQRATQEQLVAAIISAGQADVVKALQEERIVLLCAQPDENPFVPQGVKDFQSDDLFKNRTSVVNLRATDPNEAAFLNQLQIPRDNDQPVVAFLAPPGVLLGTYKSNVTLSVLAQRLSAAGKCCDDPSCKHRTSQGNATRR
ncbi:MAG: hypothetical protein CMK32_14250 [Porticoccaceae bacterium]|nr:hypothetical protein [Porticoccaceae bacterium]